MVQFLIKLKDQRSGSQGCQVQAVYSQWSVGLHVDMLYVTVQLSVEAKYPSNWNEHQTWKCILTACKASGYIVFHHKEFFQGYFFVLHCQVIKIFCRGVNECFPTDVIIDCYFCS